MWNVSLNWFGEPERGMSKRAIVLFNLGGPDSPDAVQPFLNNLFKDPAIIGLPGILRIPLAKLISTRRAPVAKEIYAHLGGKSPLLDLTQEQSGALAVSLTEQDPEHIYRVFVCMRYWHPFSDEIAKDVREFNPDEILLLPLYPQFSTTTTGSSIADWDVAARKVQLEKPTYTVCCYPIDEKWAEAQSDLLQGEIDSLDSGGEYRILFSAHGLPKKVVEKGDPYQWQVEQSAQAIAKTAGLAEGQWTVCYQSRVGPLEWIGPSLDDELTRAAEDKVAVVILPIAFVSEHSETLVELDIEYKEMAEELGIPGYRRVPALGTHSSFIQGLRDISLKAFDQKMNVGPPENVRYCPQDHGKCMCR